MSPHVPRAVTAQLSFEPADPLDAMAESFRLQVCDIAINAGDAAIFRDMPSGDQLASLMGGLLTGTLGVLFAFVEADERDALVDALVGFVPHARAQAESIMDGDNHG